MAKKETVVHLEVDITPVEDITKDAIQVIESLKKSLQSTQGQMGETFKDTTVKSFAVDTGKWMKELDDALLCLRLNFGKLKAAIERALAPVGAVVLPVLNRAIVASAAFVNRVGLVLGALFEGSAGTDAVAESADGAAKAEKNLAKAAVSAGKAVKRSLAGFDEIERLEGFDSGGSSAVETTESQVRILSPQLQAITQKILELLEPLKRIDLTPVKQALEKVGSAFASLGSVAGEGLEWLWYQVLTPLAKWIVEKFAPVFLEVLAAAIRAVTAVLKPLIEGFKLIWPVLEPIVSYIGQIVITALEGLKKAFETLAQVFTDKGTVIQGIFANIGVIIQKVWSVVGPVLEAMRQGFSDAFAWISRSVGDTVGYILDAFYGVTQFLSGAFTGDWQRAWNGIGNTLKNCVNGIIGFLNGMLSAVTGALNSVIRAINTLQFTVPDWVPGIGGETMGFRLAAVKTPQIPYLAQGAVLPANKPFLAVVGDQRHGTNVEAPLATIQEAVAAVMQEQMDGMMAGFEAVVQAIRDKDSNVILDGAVIARSVNGYNRKMRIARGGL